MSTGTSAAADDQLTTLVTSVEVCQNSSARIMAVLTETTSSAETHEFREDSGTIISYYTFGIKPLEAADYPILAALWDNEDDAIFDAL